MWWLVGLTLAGLALRIVYLISQRQLIVGGDGWHYHTSSVIAVDGQWFQAPMGGPDAHHPPLWMAVLSLLSEAGWTSWFEHQVWAALIGSTAIPLVGLAGRKIAGTRVGVIAAALAAVYPGLWQYERELLSEVLLMPLIALVFLLVYSYRDAPSLARTVVLSGVCAVLTLARAEQLALLVLVVTPLILATKNVPLKRRLAWFGAAVVTAGVVFTPWTVFNATRFEEPVVFSTGLGSTMTAGACDTTFSGPLIGYYDAGCVYVHTPKVRSLDRSQGDREFQSIALDYTRDHIDQLPAVLLAREARTFGLYRPVQEVRLGSEWSRSRTWVGYLWTVSYSVLLPLAIVGAVLLRRRRVMLYPLLAEFLIVAFAAGTTFGQIRYRAGVEVPILILASVAMDAGWRWWRRRSSISAETSATARDRIPETVG